jgi:hypothetical protein
LFRKKYENEYAEPVANSLSRKLDRRMHFDRRLFHNRTVEAQNRGRENAGMLRPNPGPCSRGMSGNSPFPSPHHRLAAQITRILPPAPGGADS